jgi:hypothetical protein
LNVVEFEGEGHQEHNNDPGLTEFNQKDDACQPEEPFVFGGEPLFEVG